jgi:hypothetical protein
MQQLMMTCRMACDPPTEPRGDDPIGPCRRRIAAIAGDTSMWLHADVKALPGIGKILKRVLRDALWQSQGPAGA